MSTPRTNPTEQEIQEIQTQAVGIAEGWQPYESTLDDDVVLKIAWQYLVDTGAAWKLQGWFGRTAQSLIDQGYIKGRNHRTHGE